MENIFRRQTLGRLGFVAILVAGLLGLSTGPAAACSVGEWDRRAQTAVFVLGRIVSVELRPHTQPPPKSTTQRYQKVVTLEVDLVLKGRAARTLTFVDAGFATKETLSTGGERISWGGGGDCSAIEEDPLGRYGAFALGGSDAGGLFSSVLHGSALGTDARDPAIVRLIESHGLSLPATSTESTTPLGAVAGLGLATAAVFLGLVPRWVRSRRDGPTALIG